MGGESPVGALLPELTTAWGERAAVRTVRWPLYPVASRL